MTSIRRTALVIAVATLAVACGSDDEREETAEEGTGSAYTQAIIESTSHDEILLPDGDMVVAVNCAPEEGGLPTVTAVAEGLPSGVYVGVFEPATGVDVTLEISRSGETAAVAEMELPEDEYVVTFEGIEGGQFDVSGC